MNNQKTDASISRILLNSFLMFLHHSVEYNIESHLKNYVQNVDSFDYATPLILDRVGVFGFV